MKNLLLILTAVFALSGCDSTPTDSEIKNLIAQKHEASTLAWFSSFSNFNKLNGFEKSDNVYLADISYSIEFTMGIGEIDSVLGMKLHEKTKGLNSIDRSMVTSEMMQEMAHIIKLGNFQKGQSKTFTEKVTLLKTENGWRLNDEN